jgi:aspartate racemase
MIIKAKNSQACLNHLISSAKRLEKSGVDFIVIPCNTVHMYINEVKKSVKIPVLSIIDESLAYLKKNSCDEIGMLATSSTLNSGIYSKAFIKMGISVQIPSVKNQKIINEIIYKIISNSHTEEDKCQLENIMDEFYTNGARAILLACTDLQVAVKKHRNLILYDTMHILAEATTKRLLNRELV